MKKIISILFILMGVSVFADNNVTITTKSDEVIAAVEINPDEYILLSDQFLFLRVDSDHYDFTFDGFPEGELQESGSVYYSGKLELSGKLMLKEGIEPGEYNIEVTFGYQSCNKEGLCYMPVEVSESILVTQTSKSTLPLYLSLSIILICLVFIYIIKRKKA